MNLSKRAGSLAVALVLLGCGAPDSSEKIAQEEGQGVEKQVNSSRASSVEYRFARMALDCVHREYPNKIAHVLNADYDAKPPRELHPAFYGCFDWHSSVHGHWLLVRLLHLGAVPELEEEIIEKLSISFTVKNMAIEMAYFAQEGRASYERPYGTAWLLQLAAELAEWEKNDPHYETVRDWQNALKPLEEAIVQKTKNWLPKLAYPIRLGTHNQSAFAFGLMLDYARSTRDKRFADMLVKKSISFHADDINCPLAYEPSGEDFLSPCLMEADLMRRVYEPSGFAVWLTAFMPQIPKDGTGDWLVPGIVHDPTDGKLVHLDGVNLSRAWALEGIASALPSGDARIASLQAAADIHKETGIAAVSDDHYAGSHWLASFATYLTTRRGIASE